MSSPTLAYVEHCLPGASSTERLAVASRLGLALELAHRGPRSEIETTLVSARQAGVPVVSLQAYQLHEAHFLHPEPAARAAALSHVLECLDLAAEYAVPRVLVVCGFGQEVCERPFESCLEGLGAALTAARALDIKLMLEPLSPLRAGAMTDPPELARLMQSLGAPDHLATAVDTGHLLDSGLAPTEFLSSWPHVVEELQLRGPGGAAPLELDLDVLLASWPAPPAVLCVEHRAEITAQELEGLVERCQPACSGLVPPAGSAGRAGC